MTAPEIYRAAIVGLGQVGMMFDADALRTGVWTHFSAYERLATHFDLVAVCDPVATRRELAARRRATVICHESLGDLLDAGRVDIVSLCTPPEFHARQITECAGRVKAIICEKPLSVDTESARLAVEACRNSGTVLAVNYYKRFDGRVPAVKGLLDAGRIGNVKLVNAIFCGPLDAVGSHMLDLLRFFFGELQIEGAASVTGDRWSIPLRAAQGAVIHLHNAGPREEFIFELDAIGNQGRVRLLNNCGDLEFLRYRESERYSGYRELYAEALERPVEAERFLPLFLETAEMLQGVRVSLTSDGENALRTQQLIDGIARCLNS